MRAIYQAAKCQQLVYFVGVAICLSFRTPHHASHSNAPFHYFRRPVAARLDTPILPSGKRRAKVQIGLETGQPAVYDLYDRTVIKEGIVGMGDGIGLRDVLREYRRNKDWTQPDLAENWNYSFETVSAWERGRRRPTRAEIPRLARLLEMDEDELAEIVYPAEAPPAKVTSAPVDHPSAGSATTFPNPLEASADSIHIHAFPSLATFPDDGESLFPRLSGLDRAIQHYVEAQIQSLWEHFHLTEEVAAIATLQVAAMQHRQLLATLAQSRVTEDDARWLLEAECEIMILLGRIARDQINYDRAIAIHKRAVALAQQSRSINLLVAATMRLAETLHDAGLSYEALQYCEAGLAVATQANARVRGELLGFKGLLNAQMGDFKESERLTMEAANCAPEALTYATAGGIRFSETAAATYQMVEALARGDHASALGHIERARSKLAIEFPVGHSVRWEAHLWIHQARAHRAVGEVEHACDDLRRAAGLAHSISSSIGMRKVQEAALSICAGELATSQLAKDLHQELRVLSSSRITT